MKLKYHRILFFYDVAELVEFRDELQNVYVGLLSSVTHSSEHYVVVGASRGHVRAFYAGEIDLRTLVESRLENSCYSVTVDSDDVSWFEGSPVADGVVASNAPKSGFFLEPCQFVLDGQLHESLSIQTMQYGELVADVRAIESGSISMAVDNPGLFGSRKVDYQYEEQLEGIASWTRVA